MRSSDDLAPPAATGTARPEDVRTVGSVAELEEIVGHPLPHVRDKARPRLVELDRQWLAVSPFCVLATADAEGRCDASPKGDPAGSLVHVIDDGHVAVAERPGNRRVDGYRNVLANPHVGLLSFVPGRGDTLRINGRARLVREAPWFEAMEVRGQRPVLAVEITVEEVFHHCAKAFLRSGLWRPDTWTPDVLPSVAEISKELYRRKDDLDELRQYYGPSYAEKLY